MKIKMLKLILPSFSIFPSVTPIYHIWMFLSEFSQQLLDLGLWNVHFQVGEVYCVNEN